VKRICLLLTLLTPLFLLSACDQNDSANATASSSQPAPATAPQPASPDASASTAAASGTSGTVVETMDAAGYTYVQVDDGNQKIWAAAPKFAVAVGDEVMVPEGMAMHNFKSETLDREFDVVYFVESVLNATSPAMASTGSPNPDDMNMPEGHPPLSEMETPETVDLNNVAKAEGGHTIAEIYADKAELSDQQVTLRGKVVKFSPQIMGTNWIHLRDGSGDSDAGTHDLTITSNVQVAVGDTIVASGPLTLDKDFGYGYQYDLIVEDASVTVE
jgi:hypothetical protein